MTKDNLYEIAEKLEDLIGTRQFLDDLLMQMTANELFEALKYIDRMNDTNLFN